MMNKSGPPWKGSFPGENAVVTHASQPGDMTFEVHSELHGGRVLFSLSQGDECFYVDSAQWRYLDATDGSIYVPVFCPKKGAGWGFLATLKSFTKQQTP